MEDLGADVGLEELAGIVARQPERHLGQIVGAEAEELGVLGDLARAQRGARQLDHGADLVVQRAAAFLRDLGRHRVDPLLDQLQLPRRQDQRDHDLGHDGAAGVSLDLGRGLEDGAGLHLVDLGEQDAQPAAAQAEHRVALLEVGEAAPDHADVDPGGRGDRGQLVALVRQELVQRRVEQADGYRQAGHDLEQLDEVGPLHRQDLGQRPGPALGVVGQDHLLHGDDAVGLEEHVLGPAQADAFGTELDRGARVERRLGVGADLEPAGGVGPLHQQGKVVRKLRVDRRDGAQHHRALRAVEGDDVALGQPHAALRRHRLLGIGDREVAGTADAGLAHAPRHDRGVAGHAAARGQDALGGVHAVDVVGRGLDPHQDHGFAGGRHPLGMVGGEHDLAGHGTRRGGQALAR